MPSSEKTLPPFPIDDASLLALEHALGGTHQLDDNGNMYLEGADYSLGQLLEFLSGFDPDKLVCDDEEGCIPQWVYPDPIYHVHDVIRALVQEVRRLRAS